MNNTSYTPKELPGDTMHAIGDVIAAAQCLEDIYCAEIDALQKPDTEAFMSLQSDKIEAAQHYYATMTQMIARKDELETIDSATKEKLYAMHAQFSKTATNNMKAVKRMQRYTGRMGKTLRDAAIRAVQKHNASGYGQDGKMAEQSPRKAISSGLSETV